MSVRRRAIHEFCNMFLRGEMKSQHGYVYKSDKRPLYLMDTGIPAMKEHIEGVGTEMFIMRPADLSYVLAFLDFVLNPIPQDPVHTLPGHPDHAHPVQTTQTEKLLFLQKYYSGLEVLKQVPVPLVYH